MAEGEDFDVIIWHSARLFVSLCIRHDMKLSET